MMSSEKNSEGPTSLAASMTTCVRDRRSAWRFGLLVFGVFVGVLDHHDGGVHHRADGDGDAAQTHDVRGQADAPHGEQGHQDGQRQRQHRHQGAAEMEQEHDADQADDDALFDQLLAQRFHGVLDQLGTVVDDAELDALGERRLDVVVDLLLDAAEHVVDVLAEADDDDASGRVALAVVIDHAAADLRAELHGPHVLDADGRAVRFRPQTDLLDVVYRGGHLEPFLQLRQGGQGGEDAQGAGRWRRPQGRGAHPRPEIAAAAHHVLAAGELQHPAAHLLIALADTLGHPVDGDLVGQQLVGVDGDLVLFDVGADRRDLGHAGDRPQLVLYVPVLQAAQLGQVMLAGRVDEGVLQPPADAGGVGPERGGHAGGQLVGHAAEVLQDAAARPIQVRSILEDDVDEREAEEGAGPHRLDMGGREQLRDDGVGDLVLDDVGAAVRPLL